MALTAYYEARSDGVHGMRAVCHVIKNRARGGRGITSVILQPAQFTVWNPGGPARRRVPRANDPAFKEALEVARMVLAGEARDITQGATHYHERSIKPSWRRGMTMTAVIGRHVFYKPRGG
jgi:spore germination cell wall hydrolase CwlJ-like protein